MHVDQHLLAAIAPDGAKSVPQAAVSSRESVEIVSAAWARLLEISGRQGRFNPGRGRIRAAHSALDRRRSHRRTGSRPPGQDAAGHWGS